MIFIAVTSTVIGKIRKAIGVASNVIGRIRKFVGGASTVIGLVCYALSTSFNNLFGKWNPLKMSLYITFSFIISLAIMFPKAWQHWRIFKYKAHFTSLILASTTVYSFYLDSKLKTKPNAYSIISSVAFAMASLCISKQIECGFLDLFYFFCGVLITQLMEIKPLFGVVGAGFMYLLVILRSNLPNEPGRPRSDGHQADHEPRSPRHNGDRTEQVAVDIFRLLQSLKSDDSRSRSRSSHANGATDNTQQGSYTNKEAQILRAILTNQLNKERDTANETT